MVESGVGEHGDDFAPRLGGSVREHILTVMADGWPRPLVDIAAETFPDFIAHPGTVDALLDGMKFAIPELLKAGDITVHQRPTGIPGLCEEVFQIVPDVAEQLQQEKDERMRRWEQEAENARRRAQPEG